MKKVLLLFILLGSIFSCKKDGEVEKILSFEVEISHPRQYYNVNDEVKISYEILSTYDFDKVPMNVKIYSDKNSVLKLEGYTISDSEYKKIKKKGDVTFVGKEYGTYRITFEFVNSNRQKVIQEVVIQVRNENYSLHILNSSDKIFVGEEKLYQLVFSSDKKNFDVSELQIKFVSYSLGRNIPDGIKQTKISLNGEEITTFDKWIPLSQYYNILSLQSLVSSDERILTFLVKYRSEEEERKIKQVILPK